MTITRPVTGALSPEQQRARIRCPHCAKWSYGSRRTARRIIRTIHAGDKPLMAYRCPTDQDTWHIGHNTRRTKKNNE